MLEYDQQHGRALLRNYQHDVFEYVEPPTATEVMRAATRGAGQSGARKAIGSRSPRAKRLPSGNGNGNGHGGPVVGKSNWVHQGAARSRKKPS
jgi:hypothetical protein